VTDVVHVITTTAPRGAERSAVELAGALAGRGWRCRTVALTTSGGSGQLDVPALGPSRLGLRTLLALRRLAAQVGVVVAHGSTTLPAAAAATIGTGTPFVYRTIGDPRYWISSRRRRLRTRLLLSRARRVVALSDGASIALQDLHGLPAAAIEVIPQATSAEAFPLRTEPARLEARAELGIGPEERLAVAIGALSPEKGLVDAVRTVAHLPSRWRLLVAGDGPERSAVEAAAAGHGDRVGLLGQIADPAGLLTAADVLILPSRTEGLPGVLIEAAMVGVPAVATRVGFVEEIVDDGITGAVVEPGDPRAIARAVEAIEDRLAGMGLAAHHRVVDRFSFDHVVDQWHTVLTTVLAPRP
jgi:glycosyltransferase involved in cell wall biosynthesis